MKGEIEIFEILTMLILAAILVVAYLVITSAADIPGANSQTTGKLPKTVIALADRSSVFTDIRWDGPLDSTVPPTLLERILGQADRKGYYYRVTIDNLQLKYSGEKLPVYPIHAILTLNNNDVKDLPGSAKAYMLTQENIKNSIFTYPKIVIDTPGIWSFVAPKTQETDSTANGKPLLFNKQTVTVSFWQESPCFIQTYTTNPQLVLLKSCCPKDDACDFLGSVVLDSTYKLTASNQILGKINYVGSKEFTQTTDDGKELLFEIENTGPLSWEKGGATTADDSIVLAIYGCLGDKKDEQGNTLATTQRYNLLDIVSKTIAPGDKITSREIGSILCKLPQQKQNVIMELYGNCLANSGYETKTPPCSNYDSPSSNTIIPMDRITPFLVNQ